MHPIAALGLVFALERDRDVEHRARRAPVRREAALSRSPDTGWSVNLETIAVRRGGTRDATSLARLAELDSASREAGRLVELARSRQGAVLVAEVGGAVVAALDRSRDLLVADPFRDTSAATELLRLRARQLRGDDGRSVPRLRGALRARLRLRTG